jgi:hypothetical protein
MFRRKGSCLDKKEPDFVVQARRMQNPDGLHGERSQVLLHFIKQKIKRES